MRLPPATLRNVYVRSERAGLRVMASLTGFIEGRLRLKINRSKSAVARPEDRHFLGFRLRLDPQTGTVEILLSERTKRNAMARIRQLTPRPWGRTLDSCITAINAWLRGWHQFFRICAPGEQFVLRALDAHIRRRLRAILLHHWKRRPTIVRNLIALGVKPRAAWQGVYQGRRSLWALSHIPQVDRALRPQVFADRGLVSLVGLHRAWHEEIVARTHEQCDAPTPAVGEHPARDDGEPERGTAHQRTRRHPRQHRPLRGAYLFDREDLAHAATLAFFRRPSATARSSVSGPPGCRT